jgi:hypothetical protein
MDLVYSDRRESVAKGEIETLLNKGGDSELGAEQGESYGNQRLVHR